MEIEDLMNKMLKFFNFVEVQGSDKPVIVYVPKIIKTIRYYSNYFTVDDGKEIKVIYEDTKEDKNGRKVRKSSKNNKKENRKTKTKKTSTHKK